MNETAHDTCRWYVVQSKPKQECRVEQNFRSWGVPILAPKLRELQISRRSPRPHYRIVPLFPNYLFAQFNAEQLLAKVRLTRGVQRVVGFGEGATAVEDSVIDLIAGRIGDDGYVRQTETVPGDLVEVVNGPLRSFVGVFQRDLAPRDRVVILLIAMGGTTQVQLAKADIRRHAANAGQPLTAA